MEGGFKKSLQLFIVNVYFVFENDVCVDLSGVLDGRPNYANITFPSLWARARCPSVMVRSRVAAIKAYG